MIMMRSPCNTILEMQHSHNNYEVRNKVASASQFCYNSDEKITNSLWTWTGTVHEKNVLYQFRSFLFLIILNITNKTALHVSNKVLKYRFKISVINKEIQQRMCVWTELWTMHILWLFNSWIVRQSWIPWTDISSSLTIHKTSWSIRGGSDILLFYCLLDLYCSVDTSHIISWYHTIQTPIIIWKKFKRHLLIPTPFSITLWMFTRSES